MSGLVAVTWRIPGSTRHQRQTLRRQNYGANSLDKLSSIQGVDFVVACNHVLLDVHYLACFRHVHSYLELSRLLWPLLVRPG